MKGHDDMDITARVLTLDDGTTVRGAYVEGTTTPIPDGAKDWRTYRVTGTDAVLPDGLLEDTRLPRIPVNHLGWFHTTADLTAHATDGAIRLDTTAYPDFEYGDTAPDGHTYTPEEYWDAIDAVWYDTEDDDLIDGFKQAAGII